MQQKQDAIKMVRKIAAMNTLYRLNRAVTDTVSNFFVFNKYDHKTYTQSQCRQCQAKHTRTHISLNAMLNLKLHINTRLHSSFLYFLVQ